MYREKLQNCSVTNLNKYLHSNTSDVELNINISANNSSEKILKKKMLLPIS